MSGLEGKTLDRYELHKLIGRGGMADVYEGYDPHMDREVAVKVFKREDEEMLRRFIREAHLMATFHNEHLVAVYDTGESQIGDVTWYYIVMPYMVGGTLRARIRRSPLSLEEACRALQDIASALDYIHRQGIIHRDIKSSNVLLDAEGRCYLSDFGIARTATDVTQLTATGNVLGTVDYVAPELFESNRRADVRSDLYSLGVLLFEMVTGQLPFTAENQIAVVTMHMNKRPPAPSSISQNISPQVERVVFRALEKNPDLRYGSATELADAFCRAVAGRGVAETVVNNEAATMRMPGNVVPPILPVPPTTPISPMQRAGSNKIILPPVPPLAANPAAMRPSSLSNATGTAQYVPSPQSHQAPPVQARPAETRKIPQPQRARSSGGRRYLVAFIIALITLLVIIVPSVYIATHSGSNTGNNTPKTNSTQTQGATITTAPSPTPTNTPNATATAQAIAAVTATAQAHATATAIAQVTATAQAQASATAGVIQTATAVQPTYQDALNDPTNAATIAAKWDGIDGTDSHCVFKSDGYHVTEGVNLVNFHGCRESGNTYKNATISVDMSMISGHSGGLFFRVNTDSFNNYSGYLFEADSQGNYKISTVAGGSPTAIQGHDWTATTALKQGYNVKNTLQVIVRDNTFLLYINGVFLTQVTDTTYPSEGNIALLATTTVTGTKADIVYSNLKVYPVS